MPLTLRPGAQGSKDWAMRSLALKLVAIFAYLLMPFTMGSAMAAPAAAPAHHESTMATGGIGHCPDQVPAQPDNFVFTGCAMMCAALPAVDLAALASIMLSEAPPAGSPVATFTGIHLDIATPPPRTA